MKKNSSSSQLKCLNQLLTVLLQQAGLCSGASLTPTSSDAGGQLSKNSSSAQLNSADFAEGQDFDKSYGSSEQDPSPKLATATLRRVSKI